MSTSYKMLIQHVKYVIVINFGDIHTHSIIMYMSLLYRSISIERKGEGKVWIRETAM